MEGKMTAEEYALLVLGELASISPTTRREREVHMTLVSAIGATPPDLYGFLRLSLEAIDNEPISSEFKQKLEKIIALARFVDFESVKWL